VLRQNNEEGVEEGVDRRGVGGVSTIEDKASIEEVEEAASRMKILRG
jgi:hypothetical protein